MRYATIDDLDEVVKLFFGYRKVFPYIKKSYITKMLLKNAIIYQDGIAVIHGKYKNNRKIGSCQAYKGDAHIAEIASDGTHNASKFLQEFFHFMNAPVWLTVRDDNIRACKFYEKNGMTKVGSLCWPSKAGPLNGSIYLWVDKNVQQNWLQGVLS
jgi:hypothetical protein